MVYRLADLPSAVLDILPPMANPGEHFNLTDLHDSSLPDYRLYFGGHTETSAFVYFIEGGFAPLSRLKTFRLDDGHATETFSAVIHSDVRSGASNLAQLREIVDRCEVIR